MPVLIIILLFVIVLIALILVLGQPDINYNYEEGSEVDIENLDSSPTSGVGYSQDSSNPINNLAQGAHQQLASTFGQKGVNIFLWIIIAVCLFLLYRQWKK